jgi:demethylmenaquinone methyltransferase/2-methoxy-6-polyprenyl-1,4-benzoquinol methylase
VGPTGRVTGVDPSAGMMAQARLGEVALLQGCAEDLPCGDASVDVVSMGYALRHLSDLDRALAEFRRVLRPGGRIVMLEITKPHGRMATLALKGYMRAVVPMAARLVTRNSDTATLWRYYWDTIEACIPAERVLDAMRRAGFAQVGHHVELGLFYEYTATKPHAP